MIFVCVCACVCVYACVRVCIVCRVGWYPRFRVLSSLLISHLVISISRLFFVSRSVFGQDARDWEALTNSERHFISMVLAFFAASDGIVMENLVGNCTLFLNTQMIHCTVLLGVDDEGGLLSTCMGKCRTRTLYTVTTFDL